MGRIILIVFAFMLVFYFINQILPHINFKAAMNPCDSCEGKGFWLGTRGDKNHCKVCDGTGQKPMES